MNYYQSKSNLIKGLAAAVGISIGILAQAQPSASVDFAQCVNIDDSQERVACYDAVARIASMPVASPEADMPSTDSGVTNSDEEQFGLDTDEVIQNDEGKDELLATISEVKETQPYKLLITFSNGQVWKQTVGKTFHLKEGDEVQLSSTRWGRDYRLALIDQPGYIQVERLR